MSWSKLAPIAKTSGTPMASAYIAVNKDQIPKVGLFLAASLITDFGEPTHCDISAGEGENEGKLLVEFDPNGAFELKTGIKGSMHVFVPLPPGCPDKPASGEPCVLGERTKKSVVIALPIAKWKDAIELRTSRPAATETRAAPQAVSGAKAAPRTLDMVEYLNGKGVKIERLAGGRFQMNGETIGGGTVLRVVNEHRKSADLDPLALAQVH